MISMKKYAAGTMLLVGMILLICVFSSSAEGALKGGTAKVDITPPIGAWLSGYGSRNKPSEGILDPLYAKALVLDDGREKVAIVSADLLWVPLEITNEIRQQVQKKLGIPQENIMICGTHTHFAPKIDRIDKNWPDAAIAEIDESYVQILKKKIFDSIMLADKGIKEVKLGVGKGQMTEIVYNRRTKKPDGTVAMTFNLPPASPDLTFGPIDPELCVLRVDDSDGSLVAAVVNYACHPVSGDPNREKFFYISADYPGYTAQVIEQAEGGNCIFLLGTAGDMNPVRLNRTHPRMQTGKALGGAALRHIQFTQPCSDVKISALKRQVSLPIKKDLPPDRLLSIGKDKETQSTEIQVLRIGDIYILGLPGEVLVEIGLEIKAKAGIENLFVVSIANDAVGYVCPRAAYKEGGYEPGAGTNLAPGAGEIITEQALKLIEQIKQGT
ncbi:MAG: neutral/alkaline non-lysosomal ceramidase N-terminal domain-containing protein [Sedimentisphaerales bacterium]